MRTKLHDYAHDEHWYNQFTIHQLFSKRNKFSLDLRDNRLSLSDLNREMISNNIKFINEVIKIKREKL